MPRQARRLLGAAMACLLASWTGAVASAPIDVPIRLQVELLSKVVAYDRAFVRRAGNRALIFIVSRAGNAESEGTAEQILAELAVLSDVGDIPHTEELVRYSSARALADLVRARRPAVIVLGSTLEDQIELIAQALDGLSVLSVGVSAAYVTRGTVLGFDVESGKPKLVVHLGRARRQHVAFRPELLNLARVLQ